MYADMLPGPSKSGLVGIAEMGHGCPVPPNMSHARQCAYDTRSACRAALAGRKPPPGSAARGGYPDWLADSAQLVAVQLSRWSSRALRAGVSGLAPVGDLTEGRLDPVTPQSFMMMVVTGTPNRRSA